MNEGLVYRTLSDLGKIRIAMHKGLGFDPSFRYVEDAHLSALTAAMVVIQDLADENYKLLLGVDLTAKDVLERYAAHLDKCAGVWVPCSERLPESIGMVVGLTSVGVLRGLEWYSGRFSFWEDGLEASPTHWLEVRLPPGASK